MATNNPSTSETAEVCEFHRRSKIGSQGKDESELGMAVAPSPPQDSRPSMWMVDSGATSHMTCDGSDFAELDRNRVGVVEVGGKFKLPVKGVGKGCLDAVVGGKRVRRTLLDVQFVPTLGYRLNLRLPSPLPGDNLFARIPPRIHGERIAFYRQRHRQHHARVRQDRHDSIHLNRVIYHSRDAKFEERTPYYKDTMGGAPAFLEEIPEPAATFEVTEASRDDSPSLGERDSDQHTHDESVSISSAFSDGTLTELDSDSSEEMCTTSAPSGRPVRQTRLPARLSDYRAMVAVAAANAIDDDPSSIGEALARFDGGKWHDAAKVELQNHETVTGISAI